MTTLTAQLEQLRAAAPPIGRGKASLLYSPQEAADIDVQTIYRVGLEGAPAAPSIPDFLHILADTLGACMHHRRPVAHACRSRVLSSFLAEWALERCTASMFLNRTSTCTPPAPRPCDLLISLAQV